MTRSNYFLYAFIVGVVAICIGNATASNMEFVLFVGYGLFFVVITWFRLKDVGCSNFFLCLAFGAGIAFPPVFVVLLLVAFVMSKNSKELPAFARKNKNNIYSEEPDNKNDEVEDDFLDDFLKMKEGFFKASYEELDLEKSAKAGCSESQRLLGNKYLEGCDGYKRDIDKAVFWFSLSAEQEDVDSQLKLGEIYESGYGGGDSQEVAMEWYRKAAEQGSEHAQKKVYEYYSKSDENDAPSSRGDDFDKSVGFVLLGVLLCFCAYFVFFQKDELYNVGGEKLYLESANSSDVYVGDSSPSKGDDSYPSYSMSDNENDSISDEVLGFNPHHVITPSLSVRSQPSSKSSVLETIYRDSVVNVIDGTRRGMWVMVETGHNEGWVVELSLDPGYGPSSTQ